jgi:hypothetical protein
LIIEGSAIGDMIRWAATPASAAPSEREENAILDLPMHRGNDRGGMI